MNFRFKKIVEKQNTLTLVKYFKISLKEFTSNQSGKPFTCNFTKTKIPSDEYFQDFDFLRPYIKISCKYNIAFYEIALKNIYFPLKHLFYERFADFKISF